MNVIVFMFVMTILASPVIYIAGMFVGFVLRGLYDGLPLLMRENEEINTVVKVFRLRVEWVQSGYSKQKFKTNSVWAYYLVPPIYFAMRFLYQIGEFSAPFPKPWSWGFKLACIRYDVKLWFDLVLGRERTPEEDDDDLRKL